MRIRLVEDDPTAARFIAKGRREASYAVDMAGTGSAALDRCHQYAN
jgi:DNA-binding response OmpR family regulator